MAQSNEGMRITPVALWIAGGLGSILWGLLYAKSSSIEASQREHDKLVSAVVAIQTQDHKDIDKLKDSDNSQNQRLSTLEAKVK